MRPYRPEDEASLRASYLAEGFSDWRPMDDAVAALVVEDIEGRPRMLVAAHAVAEVRIVVDHDYLTPKMRETLLADAHDALQVKLKVLGFGRAIAILESRIARGFGRRLQKLRGWVQSGGVAWEKEF